MPAPQQRFLSRTNPLNRSVITSQAVVPRFPTFLPLSAVPTTCSAKFPTQILQSPMAIAVLLHLSLLLTLASATPRFTPSDNYLIACGVPFNATLPDHRVFIPDSAPGLLTSTHAAITVTAARTPSSSPLSRTARIFTSPASFHFPITHSTPHILRLHFYPFPTSIFNLSAALFHVSANSAPLLANFSVSAPLLKEFLLPPTTHPSLTVSFTPASSSAYAFVGAVEVVSAPEDLIGDVARLVTPDHVENLSGLSKQTLETVHRITVGGPKVTPFNDTLWRTWSPDTGFFQPSAAAGTMSFSGRIVYRKYGASREVAPDNVYSSARIIKAADGSKTDAKLTWALPVSSGNRYLVRLHFCDIASLALNEIYFNVYINGYVASEDLDLSEAAGQVLASPYYADFVVEADSSGLLNVTIGPSKLSRPSKISGLLNGLEIMKINNAGVDVPSVLKSPRKITFGAFVRSVVCGIGFMSLTAIVFTLMMRLRAETNNNGSWTPLPVDDLEGVPAKGVNAMVPATH